MGVDAIYVRISSDRTGAGLGVARQEEDCLALCTRLGWIVYRVYIDNDVSAYSGKAARSGTSSAPTSTSAWPTEDQDQDQDRPGGRIDRTAQTVISAGRNQGRLRHPAGEEQAGGADRNHGTARHAAGKEQQPAAQAEPGRRRSAFTEWLSLSREDAPSDREFT